MVAPVDPLRAVLIFGGILGTPATDAGFVGINQAMLALTVPGFTFVFQSGVPPPPPLPFVGYGALVNNAWYGVCTAGKLTLSVTTIEYMD